MEPKKEFDAYYKKTISFAFGGHELALAVSQSLFSSSGVDSGSQRLLRTIASENLNDKKILDLGCGYGVIGVALGKSHPESIVHMVDRDALAIEFSRKNCELNKIGDVSVYPSLGYDDVSETDFDLIVSNIPAKVGEPVLAYLLTEARFFLKAGGIVSIVVIEAIADYVAGVLADPIFKVTLKKSWPGHVDYHYQFADNLPSWVRPKESALDRGMAVHALLLSQATAVLRPNGILLLASGSTEITRLENIIHSEKKLDVVERKRVRGKSMIRLTPRL